MAWTVVNSSCTYDGFWVVYLKVACVADLYVQRRAAEGLAEVAGV
jgi:hypothetical protein